MTSQHFDDGWDNWGEDWGATEGNSSNNNNNNRLQSSQANQSFNPQQQQQPLVTAPIYSPFAYSQPSAIVPTQQPIPTMSAPPPPSTNIHQHHQSQQQPQAYGNPVNFFNPSAHFNDNANNNNPLSAFNTVQSPIQTPGIVLQQSTATPPLFSSPSAYNPSQMSNENVRTDSNPSVSAPQNVQYQTAPITMQNIQPQQQQGIGYHQTEKASFTPPPPLTAPNSFYDPNQQQLQDVKNMNFQQPTPYYQQQSPLQSNQIQEQQQFPQWNDMHQQPQQNYQNWPMMNQNAFSQPQQPPVSSNSSNDWERISPDSIQFLQQQAPQQPEAFMSLNASQAPRKVEEMSTPPATTSVSLSQSSRKIEEAIFTPPVNFRQSPMKTENAENNQMPTSEPPPVSTYSAPSFIQNQTLSDSFAPENRERLDEVTTPLRPPSSSSSIERHNYLVTGQLSNEIQQQFNQNAVLESFPPSFSRMVVGEPESNQEQLPTGHRMVTGTEMTPASYMNYQRQADGEVSSSSNNVAPPSFVAHVIDDPSLSQQQQHQQNFNVGDRNLYLVAGESDMNSQRVIPGVESNDNSINNNNVSPMSVLNPLQNLHIEDDDDFVNISVSSQHRNVDGDGMEEQREVALQRQPGILVDASEQREEDIEGANDNNAENAAISMPPHHHHHNDQELEIREDIEGANDPVELPPVIKTNQESQETRRSFEKKQKPESSEDSELREVERNSKIKSRRSKKYDTNDSESEIDEEYKDKKQREKYDDRYKKSSNRDKMSREEYEKYRRREKDRRSGSRYESRRRTDDDEDEGRRPKDKIKGSKDYRDGEGAENREKRRDVRKEKDGGRKNYDDQERDRRERRRRDRYYDEEYSRGRTSQNTSDREFDRNSRRSRGGAFVGGDAPGGYYGYDPNYNYNVYYQQQQYLESLRRTNPQAYEWYKNYYGMMQQQQAQMQQQVPSTMDDIGGSLHSGYNSSTEKGRASTSRFLPGGNVTQRSLNSSFIDSTDYTSLQASSSFQPIGKDFNQAYSSLNFNQNYGYDPYADSRAKAVVPGRMTPKKFLCAHEYVNLSNGLMTTIDTSNNDNRYIVKIGNVPIYDRTRRLYQIYPGPLVRGVSHKKTIIEFCEDKLKHNSHIEYGSRASYALLWSYLILMLRQNGTYTEADISELLMKNLDDFKSLLETSSADENIVSKNEEAEEEKGEDDTDVSESEENATSERNTVSRETTHETRSAMTENNVLDKFKNFLLYGNIGDALDFATDNNLWGHALFLASKVDRRQHANVMLKFANKLPYNDPLQTLYQIMSGRMPACVTNLDDKWGDWRPHLAMIISNCTDKPDLVKRSIIALGDSLASRGDVFGSQFCYLLMDPQFTDYSDSQMVNGKIGLLGVSLQQKTLKEFATNEAIMMTEIYEYARSLSVENYFIVSLQKYKFLLATNMLDYGMQLKSLLYMEYMAKCIVQRPDLFDASFMSKIYEFGDRLKFYDPVIERAYEMGNVGTEDQKWLQDLYAVMHDSDLNEQQQSIKAPAYPSSNDVYNQVDYQPRHSVSSGGVNDPISQHQTPTHVPLVQQPVYGESEQSFEQQNSSQIYNPDYSQYQQQQQPPPPQPQQQQADFNNYSYSQNNSMSRENVSQGNEQQNFIQTAATSYDPNSQPNNYQPEYSYAGYDQSFQQSQPNITMGNSISKSYDESEGGSEQKGNESPVKKTQEQGKPKKVSAAQNPNVAAAGGGWFGGIFSKLKSKSNQMKLPDDKNPKIVWDENNKQWINKDEDPTEAEAFKPPPKMNDMMAGNNLSMNQQPTIPPPSFNAPMAQQQFTPQQSTLPTMQGNQYGNQQIQPSQQPQQPAVNPIQMSTQATQQQQSSPEQPAPPSAPNMFKLQKGRNLKKSYVDILGTSGKTIPATSKDVAPPQMDMQFFNPQAQQQQGMQFYNPNDFQ